MARERLLNSYDWIRGAIRRIVDPIAFIAEKSLDLRVASETGNIDLVNQLLEIREVRDNAADLDNEALRKAARNGHWKVVNRLCEIPDVLDNTAARCWIEALSEAAYRGHWKVVNGLLEISVVRANAAVNDNEVLRWAANAGQKAIVKKLLQIPGVKLAARALCIGVIKLAADNGCYEIVYILAKAKWPDGGVERIPAEMKAYCTGGDPVRVQISRAGAGLFAQKIINKELTGSMDSGPGDLVREFLDGPRVVVNN